VENKFELVGKRPTVLTESKKRRTLRGKPVISVSFILVLILACSFCELFMPKDPTYMDLYNADAAPNGEFFFGTDAMGRDIFSMIWYGGKISLFIGFFATVISVFIAVIFGSISGLAPKWLDSILMRFTELLLSIPSLLFVILLQAIMGKANVFSISLILGITGWMSMAKVVRSEVRQIRESEYVIAARCMGAGFWRIVWKHLAPNFVSSIMFMAVMNVRSAIVAESTLSFIGMGLPLEIISWGSLLSLAERSILSGSWWIIVIPGVFLVLTLLCLTNIGNHLRKAVNRKESNL